MKNALRNLRHREALTEEVEQSGGRDNRWDRLHIGGYGELHYNNLDAKDPDKDLDQVDFHRFVLFFGYWLPDSEWLKWHRFSGIPSKPTAPAEAPQSILRTIQHHNLGHELTWERVLLDLHSGRALTENGVYIMDVAALGMLFLAFSGILIWMQRRSYRWFRKTKHR